MNALAALLILIPLAAFAPGGKGCGCTRARPDDATRWGGNHWVVSRKRGTYRSVGGSVVRWVDQSPLGGALVEVFDKPDYLLCEWEEGNPRRCTTQPPAGQRRVAACVTGKDGQFCFDGLPAGKYELRVSKDGEWNVPRVYVVVSPGGRAGRSGGIVVGMTVGD